MTGENTVSVKIGQDDGLTRVALAVAGAWLYLGLSFFWALPKALPGEYGYLFLFTTTMFGGVFALYSAWHMARQYGEAYAFWLFSLLGACFFATAGLFGYKLLLLSAVSGTINTYIGYLILRFLIWINSRCKRG